MIQHYLDTYRPVQCLAIAAVQRERNTQFFAIITVELEAIRAPSLVAFPDSHFPSVGSY